MYGYAHYKLALRLLEQGRVRQGARRVQEDDRVRRAVRVSCRTPRSSPTRRAATSSRSTRSRAIPSAAYNFFNSSRATAAATNEKTFKMMDDLGQNYLDTGHYPEGIALYHDLMARDKRRQVLRVPGAHHRGDDGDEVRQQGRRSRRARQPGRGLQRVQERPARGRAKLKCANKTAELLAETAMAWHLEAVGSRRRARHRRPEDDGARGVPLQEGRRQLERGGVRQVRVPAHREGRLAEHLQDQVRDGRPCSTSRRTGPSAVRPSTPSSPRTRTAPEAAEAAYAAVLCYQNIYDRDAQGRLGQEGRRQPARAGREEGRQEGATRTAKFKPEGLHRQPEGHGHGLQPLRLLHQAAGGRQGRPGAATSR